MGSKDNLTKTQRRALDMLNKHGDIKIAAKKAGVPEVRLRQWIGDIPAFKVAGTALHNADAERRVIKRAEIITESISLLVEVMNEERSGMPLRARLFAAAALRGVRERLKEMTDLDEKDARLRALATEEEDKVRAAGV